MWNQDCYVLLPTDKCSTYYHLITEWDPVLNSTKLIAPAFDSYWFAGYEVSGHTFVNQSVKVSDEEMLITAYSGEDLGKNYFS